MHPFYLGSELRLLKQESVNLTPFKQPTEKLVLYFFHKTIIVDDPWLKKSSNIDLYASLSSGHVIIVCGRKHWNNG